MKKENLILIPGFGANSQLLSGLIEFLSRYFTVYCIDLPGFIDSTKPLDHNTIGNYARYVKTQIDALQLEEYIVAGISFGFLIANQIEFDQRCKSIFAITPYLNSQVLKYGRIQRFFYNSVSSLLLRLNLHAVFWHSRFFRFYLRITGTPGEFIDILMKQVNSKTYFETAQIILNHQTETPLQKIPYVVIVSPQDELIDHTKIRAFFQKAKDKLIILKNVHHCPPTFTQEYFEKYFSLQDFEYMGNFLSQTSLALK